MIRKDGRNVLRTPSLAETVLQPEGEGKVRVAGAHASVDMAPGQHLVQTGSAPWTLEARNLADLTSWREGSLVF